MENTIYSKNTIEFVTVSVEYCSFIERANQQTYPEFVETSLKLLPLLYLKAVLLPSSDSMEYNDRTEEFVSEEIYEYTRQNIERVLGEHDSYLEVFHEDIQYSETPIASNISENLTDIYQDLKNFTSVYSFGNETAMNDALILCNENFASYWGQRLTNALQALHAVRHSPDFDLNEVEGYPSRQSENEEGEDEMQQFQEFWQD